ncbi:MAG: TRAP-type mannitol/chloroaromatic compound transport system permease small subunit [Cyclobacteriaceae bacterium]|jgi:TRAP-type mannitol/chloroaromatic compound transport system permease small subunit
MIRALEAITRTVGKGVSWLSVVLVFIIVVDVFLRYFFSITSALSFELEWHVFAAMFMLSAAWALQEDGHVRVDLFYQNFGPKGKAIVNLAGTVLFLLPFCWVAGYESLSFVSSSFAMGETSPDPGGLPARFIIKSIIPISLLLLALQGLVLATRSFITLTESSSHATKTP